MIPTQIELIVENITWVIHEGEHYFDVNEVKQKYDSVKFPPDKIKKLPIGGVLVNVIRAEDIQEMTDFDKKVIQLLKYKK